MSTGDQIAPKCAEQPFSSIDTHSLPFPYNEHRKPIAPDADMKKSDAAWVTRGERRYKVKV